VLTTLYYHLCTVRRYVNRRGCGAYQAPYPCTAAMSIPTWFPGSCATTPRSSTPTFEASQHLLRAKRYHTSRCCANLVHAWDRGREQPCHTHIHMRHASSFLPTSESLSPALLRSYPVSRSLALCIFAFLLLFPLSASSRYPSWRRSCYHLPSGDATCSNI